VIKADYYGLGIKFVKAYRENHSLYRLCRNSKRALLKPVFGGVLPLNLKNNSLQRNLSGHDFADNNYDTASLHGVAKGNISAFVLPLFNGLWPQKQSHPFHGW